MSRIEQIVAIVVVLFFLVALGTAIEKRLIAILEELRAINYKIGKK